MTGDSDEASFFKYGTASEDSVDCGQEVFHVIINVEAD
jgi:hypothetical protein